MNDPKILIVMLILLGVSVIRRLAQRQCAVEMPSHITPLFSGVWMLALALATWPFFGHLWHEALPNLIAKPWVIALALGKGIVLSIVVDLIQKMRRVSSAAAEYSNLMAIGLMAIGNSLMGEILTPMQWCAVGIMSLLGVAFMLRGHLSELKPSYKILFLILLLTGATPGMFDQAVIPNSNWYSYLLINASGMVIFSLLKRPSLADIKMAFGRPTSIFGGATWGVGEMIVLALLVTHIPVTLGAVAMRLAAPLIMLIAAVFWGEGKAKNQLAFGMLGYLAILPIILG